MIFYSIYYLNIIFHTVYFDIVMPEFSFLVAFKTIVFNALFSVYLKNINLNIIHLLVTIIHLIDISASQHENFKKQIVQCN